MVLLLITELITFLEAKHGEARVNFSKVVGQEDIIADLQSSIENDRIGHAYIFSGPKGIGKKTIARIFSSILLCNNPKADKSCSKCISCRMFANGSHPDFYQIGAEGESIGVNDIRNMQEDIIVRPLYGNRKVCLINNADGMTDQAQNSLLKTLEEPPEYAVIILITSNYDALLETVRSRAVRYDFKKNSYEEVRSLLDLRFEDNSMVNGFIASYSEGIIGRALELADNSEFISIRDSVFKNLLDASRRKSSDIFEMYNFFEKNKSNVNTILNIMISFYRDVLIFKKTGNENMLINSDKKDIILNNAHIFSMRKLMRNIEIIESTGLNIKRNVNYQLSIEIMLMKLWED
jgi:DNA polymerase-3 subunit delta'